MSLKDILKSMVLGFRSMMMIDVKSFPQGHWPIISNSDPSSMFKNTKDYMTAAQTISWASVCCAKIATRSAMTPWNVYDKDKEPTKNKELIRLLSYPNPTQTFYEFNELIDWHLLLAGNAYIWKYAENLRDISKKGAKYSQLWLINPSCVEPQKSSRYNEITGYKVVFGNGADIIIPTKDIVHLKEPNPMNDCIGMGKIQANEMLYNTEYSAQYYNWNFFANGGAPQNALIIPGQITPDQEKEIKSRLREYQSVKNSHKIIPLTGGMELKTIGLSQKDMSYIEQRKFNREEMLGIFGVPPAIAGIFEYANYANTKEQNNMFLSDTIEPRNIKRNQSYTRGIVKDFEPDQEFYFDTVVKRDEVIYMGIARDGVINGLLTPNEARTIYLDMPEDEGNPEMDEFYMPINMIPISQMNELPDTEAAPAKMLGEKKISGKIRQAMYRAALNTRRKVGKTIKKEMVSFFKDQEARVLSALSTEKSFSEKKITADDIFNFEKESRELVKAISKGHTAVLMRAIQDANQIMGTDIDNTTQNPQVTARIGKLARRVTVVNETSKEKIQNAIDKAVKEGVDAGESIGEIKKRIESGIKSQYESFKGYRAEMIARTESAAAYDKGSILSYKDADVQYVDVIGCTTFEPDSDCGATHVPIDDADALEFHPNHTGCIVPVVN